MTEFISRFKLADTTSAPGDHPTGVSHHTRLRISIVTPSYQQMEHLKRCAASVSDQQGDFEVEHLIHDALSPGFTKWAETQTTASCVSERDNGMYDAINRGFRRAKGDIIAWLNCDEQYLPGTLQKVADFFNNHPDIDILFGDVILVDDSMSPIAYRRAILPTIGHIRYSHLSTFSAATFVRKRVLDDSHYLDTDWKTIADAVWIEQLLNAGYEAKTLNQPLSTFAMLGSNLGQSYLLFKERNEWELQQGATNFWLRRAYIWHHRILKLLSGAYFPHRTICEVYQDARSPRNRHVRWLWGFWDNARRQASLQKFDNEGTFSMRQTRIQYPSSVAYLYALISVVAALLSDYLIPGESTKAPLVLIFSLLILCTKTKSRDIGSISLIFLAVTLYSLKNRPIDVAVVRTLTFSVGAVLAYLLSITFRDVEEWMQITIALIRRLPQPVILTNSSGHIILANRKFQEVTETPESRLLAKNMSGMIIERGPDKKFHSDIQSWGERPPEGTLEVDLGEHGPGRIFHTKVFVVGHGKRRLYTFSIEEQME